MDDDNRRHIHPLLIFFLIALVVIEFWWGMTMMLRIGQLNDHVSSVNREIYRLELEMNNQRLMLEHTFEDYLSALSDHKVSVELGEDGFDIDFYALPKDISPQSTVKFSVLAKGEHYLFHAARNEGGFHAQGTIPYCSSFDVTVLITNNDITTAQPLDTVSTGHFLECWADYIFLEDGTAYFSCSPTYNDEFDIASAKLTVRNVHENNFPIAYEMPLTLLAGEPTLPEGYEWDRQESDFVFTADCSELAKCGEEYCVFFEFTTDKGLEYYSITSVCSEMEHASCGSGPADIWLD